MNYNIDCTLNHSEKMIVVSKKFLMQAGQFNTPEFNELRKMKAAFPDYRIEERTIHKKANKTTYCALTYQQMKDFIRGCEKETDAKERLAEFEQVIRFSKAQRASYAYVKKWFLSVYKEEFKTKAQRQREETECLCNGVFSGIQ